MAGLLRSFYAAVLLSLFLFVDSHIQKDARCPTLPEFCHQICVKLAFKTGFCDYGTCICLPVPPLQSRFLESPRFKELQEGKERNDDAEQRDVNLFLRRMSFVHRAQPIDILESVFKNDYFQEMVRRTREGETTERSQPLPKIRRNILARGGVFHMHAEMIPTARYSNEYFSRPSQFGKSSTRSAYEKVADIRLEGYKWSLNSYIKNHEKNILRKTPDTLSNVEKLKMDFEGLSFAAEESTNKPDFRQRSQHVTVRIMPTKNKEIAPKAEWFSLNNEDQKVKEEKSRGDMPISKRFVRKSEKALKNDNNSPAPLKQIVDSLNNIVNKETTGITSNETLKMSDQEQSISSEASGELNQDQNSTNGETSTNQENPTQNQTDGVTNMNEIFEMLQSINQTQNQDQKASTNENNEKPTINGDDEKVPVTDQAYNPVNSQTENSGTNETSQTEEPDTGLITKGGKLTTDQMSQEEKPISEDASQAENITTTVEIRQGEEDNGETSQGKEDNEESSQGKEAKGETSKGEIESIGETSTQGEIDTTGETSQVENATTGETSQGEKLPSGEASQGKKLTIREASQDEKSSTGESNQSEKSDKGDIISQDQKAETSEISQDEKPPTSETNQDEKPAIRESSQDQKPGTNETSQDQKTTTGEVIQDKNSGTSETSEDKNSGTSETSEDKKSGTSETSEDKNSGTSETSEDKNSGTSETSEDKNSGTSETSEDKNSGTSETSEDKNSGTSETSEDKNSGTSETSEDKNSGTSETSEDKNSGTSETSEDKNSGTSETSEDKNSGTSEISEDKNSGTSETSEDKNSGTSETSEDKNSGTSETSEDKKSGTSETSQDQKSEEQTTIIPENEKLYPFLDLPEVGEKPPNVPSENIDPGKISPRVERDLKISSMIGESDTKVPEDASVEEDEISEPESMLEGNEKEDEEVEDETQEWWKQKPTETENGNQENTDQIEEGDDLYD